MFGAMLGWLMAGAVVTNGVLVGYSFLWLLLFGSETAEKGW